MSRYLPVALLLLCAVAATASAQYCTTTNTGGCPTTYEYISNVALDTLNNPSVCSSASPTAWYEDYTGLPGPVLTPGGSYVLSVTVDAYWGSDRVRAWIDWNGDFTFQDPGEEIIFSLPPTCSGTCGATVLTGTVNVPMSAVASTRMRVRLKYSSTIAPVPCGTDTFGEVEDYTINTIPPDFAAIPAVATSPVPAGSSTLLTLTCSSLTPPTPPIVVSAVADLTAIGGSAAQTFYDDGINGGDAVAGDNVWTFDAFVPPTTTPGPIAIPYNVVDSIARSATGQFFLTVTPGNDECATPTAVVLGANGPFSNAGATDSAGMSASCQGSTHKDVFFTFTPACTANYTLNTVNPAITPVLDTVLQVYDVCGGVELACDDDGGPGLDSMIASVSLTGGVPYIIRVASFSTTLTGSFSLNIGVAGGGIAWSSPLGVGSIQWDLTGGPSFGTYFHAIWFFAGNYPNGWFLGIDIPIPEIINQVNAGFPFVGGLDACGANTLGPFGGLPSGFSIYSTALFMTGPGLSGAVTTTAPATHTIP